MDQLYKNRINYLFLVGLFIFLFSWTNAFAIGIDTTNAYAWGENVGWLNFGTSQGNVDVENSALTGYAWGENIGWVSLNCLNTSSCGTVSYGVTNDGSGNLSGYAWGENIGWLSFSCQNTSSCGTVSYGVTIDGSGNFSGFAYGENIGWVSFNCLNTSSCGTVNYKVALVSSATTSAATPIIQTQQSSELFNTPGPITVIPPQTANSATSSTSIPPSRVTAPYVTPPALSPSRFVPPAAAITNRNVPPVYAPTSNNIIQVVKAGLGVIGNGIKAITITLGNVIVLNVKDALTFIGNLFNVKSSFSPSSPSAISSSSVLSVPQNIGTQAKNLFDYIKNLISPH